MSAAPTSYDQVAYPSLIFRQYHPDLLTVIARLHGLDPPAVETARVLEVGGGDGLNAIALAAEFPRAEFVNFDLAMQPIEQGRHWSRAAGLKNVRHEVLDILDASDRLEGQFDYIVAHGVYAWVPETVRAGLMALFGRLLSPRGMAYVSYNAFPGGHSRAALRDMMLHHVAHLDEPAARIAAARALLQGFGVNAHAQDQPITAAMRREAQAALTYPDGQFFHDGLSGAYAPQALLDVVRAAEPHGLRYLGDATGGGQDQGFLDAGRADMDEASWLNALQALDYRNGRYFRASLFVRQDAPISRAVVTSAAQNMWISTRAVHAGGDRFTVRTIEAQLKDARSIAILQRLIALKPHRMPVAELAEDAGILATLCHHCLESIVDLHTVPAPFAAIPADRPVASPLARMQIAEGEPRVATLDHRMIAIADARMRGLIASLDGSRNREALERYWRDMPAKQEISLEQALARIAANALLAV